MKSNLDQWKTMQEREYFEKHPRYKGLLAFGKETVPAIEQFTKLDSSQTVVVVGCGYGRECVQLALFVRQVYGIDVNPLIIKKAMEFTRAQGMTNFTGVIVDNWEQEIPGDIDIVYSMVVMQHLTRDLVYDYFNHLPKKLSPSGIMIIQFLEKFTDIYHDAEIKLYEPQVSWTKEEIEQLAEKHDLQVEIKTIKATELAVWHWCGFRKREDVPAK